MQQNFRLFAKQVNLAIEDNFPLVGTKFDITGQELFTNLKLIKPNDDKSEQSPKCSCSETVNCIKQNDGTDQEPKCPVYLTTQCTHQRA